MDLFLDPGAGKPLTTQLYEQLRDAITEGRLLAGDQLVPSRQLADELGVSRHTVTTVYGRLVAEGYAEGRAGGGSVVASASPVPPKGASPQAALRPSPRFAGWSPYFRPPPYGCRFDLRPGLPDPALFPAAQWRRQVSAAVGAEQSLYGDPAGKIRLRRAIVSWVARSRSVAATEDTVVVTCGTQHAIDLVTRVLLEPGDCVAVEDPGYVPAIRLFEALGMSVVGVPVDDQGLVVDLLPPSARIVYVTPSHQCRCHGAGHYCAGRSATTRRSSKMTTTPNSATSTVRWNPSRPSTRMVGWCTWAHSQRRSPHRSASASPWCPSRWPSRSPRSGSSSTGIRRSRCRPPWPASSTTACSTSTSGGAGASTPSVTTSLPMRSSGRWPATSPPALPTPDCTSLPCCRKGLAKRRCCKPRPDMAWSHPACTTAFT